MRTLFRHPSYALTSLAAITLAVGANLVVFSFINALWLKPRAAADPDRVVLVGLNFDRPDASRFSELGLDAIRETGAFESVAGQVVTSGDFEGIQRRIAIPGVEGSLESAFITPGYFSVLGVRPAGRDFARDDGFASGPSPAIISDRLWRTALRGRTDVMGLQLPATPVPLIVVGVAPPAFHGARLGERTDLWLPYRLANRLTGQPAADLRFVVLPMVAMGRLRPGQSIDNARSMLDAGPRGPRPDRELIPLSQVFGAADVPMVRLRGADVMTMSAAMAGLVLAGGCATLMALVLVHYERRQRELTIRAALGASRGRLAAKLVLELFGLAIVGTGAAVLVASWALAALPAFTLPGGVDFGRLDLTLDWRVGAAGLTGCLVTLALAGALPLARFTSAAVNANLMSSTSSASRSSTRLRRLILAGHVGVTTVVLVAAALFVQSVTTALATGPRFDADHVVFANVPTRYGFMQNDHVLTARKARDLAASFDALEQIRQLPGVQIVAIGDAPLGVDRQFEFGQPKAIETDAGPVDAAIGWMFVGDDYLEALGVPLLAGRPGGQDEVVVSPAFAQAAWGAEAPLGERVKFGTSSFTVTGVADMSFGAIRLGPQAVVLAFGRRTPASVMNGRGVLPLVIRTDRADATKVSVERVLFAAFPDSPVRVATGREVVDADLGRERMNAWVFSGFGIVTLTLAAVSIFGLVAYVIESRRRELAVRMALGATRGAVAMRTVWTSLEPVLYGLVAGLVAAAMLARTIEAYLYGLSGVEPLSYALVSVTLVTCAIVAAALAGRRILTVSVSESLRQE